ncbi:MAG: hypothetical protein ACRDYU_13970 [Actinomycetes bacterium]
MRKILTALASAGLACSTLVIAAPTAEAHSVPCVTKYEFRKVFKGMSMARVHRIFDMRGTQDYYFSASAGYPAEQGRHYRACTHYWPGGPHGDVYVDYKRRDGVWRVTDKTAFW